MEVNVIPKPEKSQAELKISVPIEDFKPFIEKAARKLSSDKPIKGFRPGKAPTRVVADTIGKERLLKEAMDMALPRFFVDAVVQHNIEAINRPNITIEELGIDTPLRFTAIVDVLPEVQLGDPKKIKAAKREVTATDEQVDHELTYLAKMRSKTTEIARPAQKGDVVMTDFRVSTNGKLIKGGDSKNHPVVIGEGHFVPDFEKNITGMSAGDTRQFTIEFPQDFPKKDMRGKKADVEVKVHAVYKRIIPKLDNEFAKSLGNFTSLQHLKDNLKKNLTEELKHKEHERYLGDIAEKFSQQTSFGHIPDALIEKEIDHRLRELSNMLAYQQKTIDDYLAQQKKTMEQVRHDMRASAEKQVKIGLTLRKLAEEQRIKVTEEEVEKEANKQLQRYKDVKEAEKHVDPQELQDHIASVLKNRKTLEKLAELITE